MAEYADATRPSFWSTVLSPGAAGPTTPGASHDTLPSLAPTRAPSMSPLSSETGSESSPRLRDDDLATLDTAEVLSSMKFASRGMAPASPGDHALAARRPGEPDGGAARLPGAAVLGEALAPRLGVARAIHKPYTCGEPGCSSRFSHISSKYRHYRTVHLGRRDHRCEVPGCGLSFGERSGLTKHTQSVHAKIRKYACSWAGCSLRFSFRLHLQQHVQTVHLKQRPFHCTQCDSRFGQRSSLTRHVRQIHSSRME